MQDTLETKLVALEGRYRLVEEIFSILVTSFYTSDIDLFPFDWDIVGLEDSLDSFGDFSTNTITLTPISVCTKPYRCYLSRTWNQSNCVFSAKFSRLEDIGVDCGIG